ncbi:3-hydroxyacyl-CoA dehydrogenase family protein [Subtercola frigoramans]|uniref:3-hydroxybutyryl-CoA dehydrogenase n=1 Tax=Subtercola frigoramans TaxID=120298 RepID=A0ABS2L9T1_9MICO|nr:3-hydroxyacyl-CoA dehydrogenase family protein [Subtercola frigoramans]MBM7473631.1 3-hydroxybutyryl-CoA dehydrogenase [Subtercola frigoramans]
MIDISSTLPARVGVLGGGRMGAGIAHAFLLHGCDVVVIERDDETATAALERVRAMVLSSATRAPSTVDVWETCGQVQVSTDIGAFTDRQLVVEAVPEQFDLKTDALRRVESVIDRRAALATNTSSLSITALASCLDHPDRFIGLHFFNPVPASALVEIVVAPKTSRPLRTASAEWVRRLDKTPVVVSDTPGFASSRLGVAIALEAMRMLEDGVASAEDIDLAMQLGYKHPSGPLKTTDIVGLDVRLGIAEYLEQTLGERFAPPRILRDKVAAGELGRKAGKGFYDWSSPS